MKLNAVMAIAKDNTTKAEYRGKSISHNLSDARLTCLRKVMDELALDGGCSFNLTINFVVIELDKRVVEDAIYLADQAEENERWQRNWDDDEDSEPEDGDEDVSPRMSLEELLELSEVQERIEEAVATKSVPDAEQYIFWDVEQAEE